MMLRVEKAGKKSLKFFPLQRSSKNQHITIATFTFAELFHPNGGEKLPSIGLKYSDVRHNLNMYEEQLWGEWFRTGAECFHELKGYKFGNMIVTDGVSCGLVYQRKDVKNGRTSKQSAAYEVKAANRKREPHTDDTSISGRISSDSDSTITKPAADKKVVGVDPNMWNLLYMVEEGDAKSPQNEKRLRYTQGTQLQQMKKGWLDTVENELKEEQAGSKTVGEWECETQGMHSKSLSFETFKQYCTARIEAFEAVGEVQR